MPASYDITLTYHNESEYAPDGRPMLVGKVSGTIHIERHQ